MADDLRIVDYAAGHRDAFRDLNLEWIGRYFVVEEADRRVLDDPDGTILRAGGHILMAMQGDAVVGCCALIPEGPQVFELAKMAVTPAARGRGIGLALGRAALAQARRAGARRVELVTNSSLAPALHVYRKLGFVEVPVGSSEYARADVRMVHDLESVEDAA